MSTGRLWQRRRWGRKSKRCGRSLTAAALVMAAGVCLLAAAAVCGHDEPCKTAAERAEREKTRNRMQAAGIRTQSLWVIEHDTAGQVVDSSLRLRNYFDRRGNAVEQVVYEGTDSTRMVSLYDKNNTWLGESAFRADTMAARDSFVYNSAGLIAQIVSYDHLGAPTEVFTYDYDFRDNLITAVKRRPNDSLVYSIRYRYEPESKFGRLMEVVQTNGDGSRRAKVINRYTDGQRVEKRVFDPNDRLTHAFKYLYIAGGDIAAIIKVTHDSVAYRQAYTYDDTGLLLTISERDGADRVRKVYRYAYEYYGKER